MPRKTKPPFKPDALVMHDAMCMLTGAVETYIKDHEALHIAADDVLCQVLCAEGYAALVAKYRRIKKYYA